MPSIRIPNPPKSASAKSPEVDFDRMMIADGLIEVSQQMSLGISILRVIYIALENPEACDYFKENPFSDVLDFATERLADVQSLAEQKARQFQQLVHSSGVSA